MSAIAERQSADERGSGLVAVLERAWSDIRDRHRELPAIVIITGAGSGRRRGGLRLGHFAAARWTAGENGRLAELFVAGEGLERGAVDVLVTLLHEAAHALAHVRGIQDTSRQGRYHNTRYRQLAREVGLHAEQHQRLGWTITTLAAGTAMRYGRALAELEQLSFRLARDRERAGDSGRSRPAGMLPCTCRCARRIRVSPGTLAAGAIRCGECARATSHPTPHHTTARRSVL